MSRHGKCRCGAVLTFRRRHGYKTRCAACGKVVRLQPDVPPAAEAPSPAEGSGAFEAAPDIPMVTVVEEEEAAPVAVVTARTTIERLDQAWTWQWLVVWGGLVGWLIILSILAWWWWQ